jgi:acetyl-CoA C-acetyltransferase
LVAAPYTKTMVANLPVDMGAAYIVMSAGRAQDLGISPDLFVFPHVVADASDHWFISDRVRLDDSPAMRLLWESIRSTGVSADDLDAFDIYSCFPTVVQTAAEILGVDPLADERPLTLIGGLTFGGGPGNNYTTHGICQMVDKLRGTSRRGLTTGLGWFSTKHSWGILGGAPADHPFRHFLRQDDVDALPRCETLDLDGEVTVESFTVVAGRDNELIHSTIAGRHSSGVRTWARNDSPDVAQELLSRESPDMVASIAHGQFTLRDS